MPRSPLAATIASCLLLTACGGGTTRTDPPPQIHVPAPAEQPVAPLPPPPHAGHGGYRGREDNLLVATHADAAHLDGITGSGVRIGVMDDELRPAYAPLHGRLAAYDDYTHAPGTPESSGNPKRGHGTILSALILGQPVDDFAGGIAPDALLHYARICAENVCSSAVARAAAESLANAGALIVNLSLGRSQADPVTAALAATAWAHAMDPIVRAGGLVVAAAGNGSPTGTTPSFPGVVPTLVPSLEDNWLTVAAVEVDAAGAPTRLSPYSNPCGDAAMYCLVAPGLYTTPALSDSTYRGTVSGTSMATAAVTGVAALVSSAFPWMTGHQLQQTVLTTTTDLGPAGVDGTYGWGMIDSEKASRGPGALLAPWDIDVAGASTFFNDISGPGSLTKQGPGSLTLAGHNTYAGDTFVREGTLNLTGTVDSGVLLAGDATFAPRGGRVGGDYTVIGTTGTTEIELGMPLLIGGDASIGGRLMLLPPRKEYTLGGAEQVLSSRRLEGTFDSVGLANDFFWTATLQYGTDEVTALLERSSANAAAKAAGLPQSMVDGAVQADALVAALDAHVQNADTIGVGPMLTAVASLQSAPTPLAAAALDTLTGQIHGTQRTLGVITAMNDLRIAADRLPHLAGTRAPTAWTQAGHVDGTLARPGYASANYRTSSLTIGIDMPIGEAGTLTGVAMTSGRHHADVARSSSRLDADHRTVIGYVHRPFNVAYVSGIASYGAADVDTSRNILSGATAERTGSRRDDDTSSARIEVGLTLASGLAPFIGIGAIQHTQGAFSEMSGSGLGLTAGADTARATFGDIGTRMRLATARWTWDGVLAFRHVVSEHQPGYAASFTGLPEAKFTIVGAPVAANAVRVAVGASFVLSPRVSLHGDAGAEHSTHGSSTRTANVSARWAF